ncbi:peptidoglycan editing factor PgeF [soil metagenome]
MSTSPEGSVPPAVAGGLSLDPEHQSLTDSPFYWRERDGVKVLVSRDLDAAGFANGFSTRLGGVSPFPKGDLNLAGFDEDTTENIMENRRRFLNVFGSEPRLATAWQVHGDTIKTVATVDDIGNSEDRADSLVSSLPGVLVGVKTADCVPVLIGDPATGAFAAVHAGWRGTVQSIVGKTVARMAEVYLSKTKDLIAAIGPAATCENYEIGEDVISAFADNFEGSEKYFVPTREGHARVDLHAANRDQLITAGIPAKNISVAPFCTMDRPDLFFSYRLEKRTLGKTGRLLSVIGKAF